MVSGMMKKTMITLVLLGCAFLLPAQTKTTVQGRIENAENLRLYYYLNEESYPVSVDGTVGTTSSWICPILPL